MKLNKGYIERLKKLENLKFNSFLIKDKMIHHISDNARGNLYENITRVDFIGLYTNILIGLFDEGLLEESWKEDIDRVRWFLKNRNDIKSLSPNEYHQWKVHCNSLYSKIKSPYVVEYMSMFYSDLIEKYEGLIVYIDVDRFYINSDKEIEELKIFNHSIEKVNYFYAEELKKYIEQDKYGEIRVSGFRDKTKKEYLVNLIKQEVRRRKLNNLGI
jgi:hypothetical protein